MMSATVYASFGEKLKVSTFATEINGGPTVIITIEKANIHLNRIEELDILAAGIAEAREWLLVAES